jgi:hypothetical protein
MDPEMKALDPRSVFALPVGSRLYSPGTRTALAWHPPKSLRKTAMLSCLTFGEQALQVLEVSLKSRISNSTVVS